jgi:hypothetical protein
MTRVDTTRCGFAPIFDGSQSPCAAGPRRKATFNRRVFSLRRITNVEVHRPLVTGDPNHQNAYAMECKCRAKRQGKARAPRMAQRTHRHFHTAIVTCGKERSRAAARQECGTSRVMQKGLQRAAPPPMIFSKGGASR